VTRARIRRIGKSDECPGCGRSLEPAERFCPGCGAPTPTAKRERFEQWKEEDRRVRAAMRAGGLVFVGTLGVILLANLLLPEAADGLFASAVYGAAALVGFVALRLLGPGALRSSLGGPPTPRGVLEGLGIGIATSVVAAGYSFVLVSGLGLEEPPEENVPPIVLALFASALHPALFEEWLDRGVLWIAALEVGRVPQAILVTSLLFAISHVFAASVLVFPLFFGIGCALGWLRFRHGSLVPGIVAHFVHNGVIVLAAV